jgi:two-component system, NtrC family, response regulator HydG
MQKEQANILVIDDDADVLLTAEIVLKQKFSNVKTASHPDRFEAMNAKVPFDVVLLDMNYLPGDNSGKDGLAWIDKLHKKYPGVKIIVITAYGDIGIAVEAMKKGAIDFVTKPWEYEKIQTTVSNVFKLGRSEQKVVQLQRKEKGLKDSFKNSDEAFIGKSENMKTVFKTITKVAKTDANVLIVGENGTGKTLAAQSIHNQSTRADEVFMSVDLGSLSESLFESELFGHKKGAFTDAKEERVGRFEAADGGTLFLDEIGNLSPSMQTKLLTVLQQREVTRLGENQARKFDVRIIAATNRNIQEMIQTGTFREDLYYRLNTIELELPPLRSRVDDLEILLNRFVIKFCKRYHREHLEITNELIGKLSTYSWPGNIRELEHATERAIILAEDDTLKANDFFLKKSTQKNVSEISTNLEELEEMTIKNVIDKHSGNMSKVAKELGIGRTTLYRKLEKYGF